MATCGGGRDDHYTPDALHPADSYALAVVRLMVVDARSIYRRESEASMKVKVTLRFRDFSSNPAQSWAIGGSSWASDQKRVSTGDLKKMFEHALEHTLAMVAPNGDLTITLETTEG